MPIKNIARPALIGLFSFFFGLLSGCSGANETSPTSTIKPPPGIVDFTTITNAQSQREAVNAYNRAPDLWPILGEQFELGQNENNDFVKKERDHLIAHKDTLYALLERARPYLYYIYLQVQKRHLPPELVLLPVIESGYNPMMCSDAGACGLWQLMPGTASGLYVKQNWWFDGRRDIVESTNAALDLMEDLQRKFNGNWLLAIAAYDTGAGTVDNAMKENARRGQAQDFWDLNLSEETEQYVPKLLALAEIIKDPSKYGVTLPETKDATYLAQVTIDTQIDIPQAAEFSGLSEKTFDQINPGFNRWATNPSGKTTLLIPITDVEKFENNIQQYAKEKHPTWEHYTVQRGDSLASIAKKFNTSVNLIEQLNNLPTHKNVRIHLTVPLIIAKNATTLSPKDFAMVHQYMAINNIIPGPKMAVHEVKQGETLWSIAKEYGANINDLRYWNHLGPDQNVEPNFNLIIWSHHNQNNPSIVEKKDYIVRRGDSLSSLAVQFNTTVDNLKKENHLQDDTISIGQRLIITTVSTPAPGAYEVKLPGTSGKK